MTFDPNMVQKSDITAATRYISLVDKVVTNTTTETSALPTTYSGSGLTLAAGKLTPGTTIRIQAGGIYTTPVLSPGNLTIKLKLGNTVMTSTVSVLISGMTNAAWDFNVFMICRSMGATGAMAVMGGCNFAGALGTRAYMDMLNVGNDIVIDTTVSNVLDLTLTWSIASTDRKIVVKGAVITIINP